MVLHRWRTGAWQHYRSDLSPQAAIRMTGVGLVFALTGIVVCWLVPFGEFRREDWWKALTIAVIVFAFSLLRLSQTRFGTKTYQPLTESILLFSLLWLSPWWFLIAATGSAVAFMAFFPEVGASTAKTVYHGSAVFVSYVLLCAAEIWVLSAGFSARAEVLIVALVFWLVSESVRSAQLLPWSWARFGTVDANFALWELRTAPVRVPAASMVVFLFDLLGQSVSLFSLGVIVAAAVATLMHLHLNNTSLQHEVERQSRFAQATAGANNPRLIEEALLQTLEPFGRINHWILRASTAGVRWWGNPPMELQANLCSKDRLERFVHGTPSPNPFGRGLICVSPLDSRRGTYLIGATKHRRGAIMSYWQSIDVLVRHARLSIEAARSSGELAKMARVEFHRARTDPLTGLPNRFAAETWLDEQLVAVNSMPVAVIVVEMVGYQQLVDVLGRDEGEAVALAASRRLKELDGVAFLARLDCNTFCLFANATNKAASELAHRAIAATGEGVHHRQSFAGVAIPQQGEALSAQMLMGRAQLVLKRARQHYHVVLFGRAEADRETRRMKIRLGLNKAIIEGQVTPAFQPQIHLRSGEVIGLEVLARWHCPELGQVSPAEFIGVAEESGQIEMLTLSILHQALGATELWREMYPDLSMSINLSARSLNDAQFFDRLVATFRSFDQPIEKITLELTESTMALESIDIVTGIHNLSTLGFRVSIDDFGTGYSSISYLDRFPIDEVKLDTFMTDRIGKGEKHDALLRNINNLCRDLGLEVVAEGIETEEQYRALQELGCQLGQGYLIARPMDADATCEWLRHYQPARTMSGHF